MTQPDSIVPDPGNPQAWNRYSYALNNPIRYTDPTGHRPIIDNDENGNPIVDPDWPQRQKQRRSDLQWPPGNWNPAIPLDYPVPGVPLVPPTWDPDYNCFGGQDRLSFHLACKPYYGQPLGYSSDLYASDPREFGPIIEMLSYFVDIAEYRGLLSNRAAFKLGFGLDAIGQLIDDSGSNYNLEARVERSLARGFQGNVIGFASTPFGLAGAGASEVVGPLPGDGVIGFGIGYVAANKTFSNGTEPFMQNTIFPLFPLFTK
jgi:hypothetical protein